MTLVNRGVKRNQYLPTTSFSSSSSSLPPTLLFLPLVHFMHTPQCALPFFALLPIVFVLNLHRWPFIFLFFCFGKTCYITLHQLLTSPLAQPLHIYHCHKSARQRAGRNMNSSFMAGPFSVFFFPPAPAAH